MVEENANEILLNLRKKNVNRLIIGTLNINTVLSKLDQLQVIIGNSLDILTIQETKLDKSVTTEKLKLNGFSDPYRLDRNKHGGGVLIYVREGIPWKPLEKHTFTRDIEGIFIEINLRKTKILFFAGYRSEPYVAKSGETYGCKGDDFLEELTFALDQYSKFLLAGDFNMEEGDDFLDDFLIQHSAKGLVKEPTCFKSLDNPSCIDLFLTNSSQSFQNTTAVATGLSDFHKMSITVLKTSFQKAQPKIFHYRDRRNFNVHTFRGDLKSELGDVSNYSDFEEIFLKVLDKHAPVKKKVVRANDKPFMTKALRRAIMVRSSLRNKFMKYKTPDLDRAFKKQRNYTNKLLKKEKKRYLSNLDMKNVTDNKKFWQTMKPFFGNTGSVTRKITLVEGEEVISSRKMEEGS